MCTGTEQIVKRVWRYQRSNQNPYIEEQTIQWTKEKAQKDKQRSTKHTYKTKDRVTRTPLNPSFYYRDLMNAKPSPITYTQITTPSSSIIREYNPIEMFSYDNKYLY